MEKINEITNKIISASITVHKALGPGLLESVYHECLFHELKQQNLNVKSELAVPLKYKNRNFDTGFRLDLLVEDSVIVEVKAVESINPVCKSQLLTYLRLSNIKIGLLLNFNVELLKNGIVRLIN